MLSSAALDYLGDFLLDLSLSLLALPSIWSSSADSWPSEHVLLSSALILGCLLSPNCVLKYKRAGVSAVCSLFPATVFSLLHLLPSPADPLVLNTAMLRCEDYLH